MFVLAMLAATLTIAARQEKTAEKPAAAPKEPRAIAGAAEMERLKFYLGEWDYTETYRNRVLSNGGKNTGFTAASLGPADNRLSIHFARKGRSAF